MNKYTRDIRATTMKLATRKRYLPPGYTLVEIMVAMLIALIVMGGVYRTLLDEDVNKQRSEMILEMQNNARVALEHLTRDTRRAAFLGCGGGEAVNALSNAGTDATKIGLLTLGTEPPPLDWDGQDDILSWIVDKGVADVDYLGEALGFSDNAAAGHPLYQEGTDAITLVYLADERAVVDGADPNTMTAGTDSIYLTTRGFERDDILYVSDCANFSLFQKTSSNNTFEVKHELAGLNTTADLGKNYGQTALARVFRLNTDTYFIHTGDYNLCHNAVNRSIATNIEDLQFEFLFDEDNDGNLSDEDWAADLGAHTSKEVRAIRIWVLAMSQPDFGYTNTNKYVYTNSPYKDDSPAALAPAGPANSANRHRFLASAVVILRNAGLLLE